MFSRGKRLVEMCKVVDDELLTMEENNFVQDVVIIDDSVHETTNNEVVVMDVEVPVLQRVISDEEYHKLSSSVSYVNIINISSQVDHINACPTMTQGPSCATDFIMSPGVDNVEMPADVASSDEDSDYDPSTIGTDNTDEESSDTSAEELATKMSVRRVPSVQVNSNNPLPGPSSSNLGNDATSSLENHLPPNNIPQQGVDEKNGSSSSDHQVLRRHSRALRKERKDKRNTGLPYTTAKGKLVSGRSSVPLPNCRMKCNTRILPDTRDAIFKEYWGLANRDKRVSFIASLIESSEPMVSRKRTTVPESKRRNRTATNLFGFKIDGERVRVCRGCFMKVLNETNMFVTNVINNSRKSTSGVTADDRRGKHSKPNKHSAEKIELVRKHIKSFPLYESHYTRRESTRLYLPPHLSLRKMYRLYCAANEVPVSRKIYEKEFRKMKISFKKPKVDTCNKCDVLALKLKVTTDDLESAQIQKEIDDHHAHADEAYLQKNEDKILAKKGEIYCYAFDLQQCLPTPYLNSASAFYCRQLWTYNLTMHEMGTGTVKCYMWDETQGGRGANQIATCVFTELLTLPSHISHVILYSDSCGGQNRNSHMAAMFLVAMQRIKHLKIIDHKFMVVGHSHMECDVDHGQIEKHKKRTDIPINHPHDWYQLVRSVGTEKKFNVIEQNYKDFLQFSDLLKKDLILRKEDTEGRSVNWLTIRWCRYTKEFGTMLFKESLRENETFRTLSFKRRNKNLVQLQPAKSYSSTLPVSVKKKNDLLSLLPQVAPIFHPFYETLKTDKDVKDTLLDENTVSPDELNK